MNNVALMEAKLTNEILVALALAKRSKAISSDEYDTVVGLFKVTLVEEGKSQPVDASERARMRLLVVLTWNKMRPYLPDRVKRFLDLLRRHPVISEFM